MSEVSIKVSVIIIIHNSVSSLPECLTALKNAARDIAMELICVDNGSVDSGRDKVMKIFPDCIQIINSKNSGFARACNQAVSQATGELLFFLNPDIILDSDAVSKLIDAIETHESPGLISGRLRNRDGSFQPSCRNIPSINNLLFSRNSWLSKLTQNSGKIFQRYTLPDFAEITIVPAVGCAMAMIKKDVYKKVGGFDNRFFVYLEDSDLSLRLAQSGYYNLFVPHAGAIHDWGTGSSAGELRRGFYHHRSMWMYFLKHQPNGFSLLVLPFLLVVNLILVLLFSFVGRRING